jgi:hypothetical protein
MTLGEDGKGGRLIDLDDDLAADGEFAFSDRRRLIPQPTAIRKSNRVSAAVELTASVPPWARAISAAM